MSTHKELAGRRAPWGWASNFSIVRGPDRPTGDRPVGDDWFPLYKEPLSPPDGVGLTRYVEGQLNGEPFMFLATDGEWVRYEDAAVAIAAEKERGDGLAERLREIARGWIREDTAAEADLKTAEARCDTLAGALETADSWLMLHARHVGSCLGKSLCTCGLTAIRAETGAALSTIPAKPATEEKP